MQVSHDQFSEMLQLLRNKVNLVYRIEGDCWLKKDYRSFQITKIGPKTDKESVEKALEYDSIVKYGQYRFQFKSKDRDGVPVYNSHPILPEQKQTGDSIDFGIFSKKLCRSFIDEKISIQERTDTTIGEQNRKIIFVLVGGKIYLREPSKHDTAEGRLYIKKIRNR